MKKIGILNYELGNLKSIKNAMDYCGFSYVISSDVKELQSCERLIVPGVGAFGTGMQNLKKLGLDALLIESFEAEKPMLGICLGYQLMCTSSAEFGHTDGLSVVPSVVRKIEAPILPHIGWSSLDTVSDELKKSLYKEVDTLRFYFVHTYAVDLSGQVTEHCSVTQYYNDKFASSVKVKNAFGVQFHPEKSSEQGLAVLKNFYNY